MYQLAEYSDLAKKGLISQEEFLKKYNETLGQTVGITDNYITAQDTLVSKASLYIDYIRVKAKANEALNLILERQQDLEDIKKGGFGTTLMAQFSYFKKNLGTGGIGMAIAGIQNQEDALYSAQKGKHGEIDAATKEYVSLMEEIAKKLQSMGYTGKPLKDISKAGKKEKAGKVEDLSVDANIDWLSGLDTDSEYLEKKKRDAQKAMEAMFDSLGDKGRELLAGVSDQLSDADASLLEQLIFGRKKGSQSGWTDELKQRLQEIIADGSFDVMRAVSDNIIDKEMQGFKMREDALKNYYDNELRFIEQSGFSSAKKERMKQKLQAETAAKEKQLERERIAALRKGAIFQKGIDVAALIASTSIAIMNALKIPIYGEAKAITLGVQGALQLAKIIATPIPQYAKGRKGGKAEWAIVGEQGQEVIAHQGQLTITPDKPTMAFLPEGAEVIPHHELIKNAAYVHLSKQGQVTTDKLQAALIEKFEQYHEDNLVLQAILRGKNFTYNHKDLSGYEAYRQSKVR
jgi:hypothetical protein